MVPDSVGSLEVVEAAEVGIFFGGGLNGSFWSPVPLQQYFFTTPQWLVLGYCRSRRRRRDVLTW